MYDFNNMCYLFDVMKQVIYLVDHIGGIIVSVLASSAVDCGFEAELGQTKDYEIGICCLSAKTHSNKERNKDWLASNQDNVSELCDMSFFDCCFS